MPHSGGLNPVGARSGGGVTHTTSSLRSLLSSTLPAEDAVTQTSAPPYGKTMFECSLKSPCVEGRVHCRGTGRCRPPTMWRCARVLPTRCARMPLNRCIRVPTGRRVWASTYRPHTRPKGWSHRPSAKFRQRPKAERTTMEQTDFPQF